ncbi:hypothetical protein NDU88_011894 [Pleurodeles waltl]|uniref:Uncharacterized protein n=1 Tax=Pleurodeles waltl TaxID=8319 RepID=A0AAV7R4F1_PLEWA|nr:hypothetical protein NDU88_011894 [Pleurodeles waltl]
MQIKGAPEKEPHGAQFERTSESGGCGSSTGGTGSRRLYNCGESYNSSIAHTAAIPASSELPQLLVISAACVSGTLSGGISAKCGSPQLHCAEAEGYIPFESLHTLAIPQRGGRSRLQTGALLDPEILVTPATSTAAGPIACLLGPSQPVHCRGSAPGARADRFPRRPPVQRKGLKRQVLQQRPQAHSTGRGERPPASKGTLSQSLRRRAVAPRRTRADPVT